MTFNIADQIFANADGCQPALIADDREISFAGLEALVDGAAAALRPFVAACDRLGLHCPNGIDHIVWSLAALRLRAVLVPIAPELSPVERDALTATVAVQGVLCSGGKDWHRESPRRESLDAAGLAPASLLAGWNHAPADYDEAALNALNPALIRFSSGTTGRRKGIVLSHETLRDRVVAGNAGLGIGPGDRVIWILPMAHHFAVSIILYLLHGATTVIERSHLGEDVFAALERHRGTVIYASPFHYALLASCPAARPVPSLRLAVSTAAALPAATAEKFLERFGLPLTQALGIIECGLPILNRASAAQKPESIGRPQPAYAAEIRGSGDLYVRGPGFADAYLAPWMTRDAILDDGWFHTGDQARIDAGGDIFLVGRSHSVINVGGMKCFPEEVEAALDEHPDVRESRVSALPHPTFGSVPVAEIVPADPAAPPRIPALVAHCRARLSNYKLPVKYTFVAALPRTPSGKIQR